MKMQVKSSELYSDFPKGSIVEIIEKSENIPNYLLCKNEKGKEWWIYSKDLEEIPPSVQKIARRDVLKIIQNSKGMFLTVMFNKLNNENRIMNCRFRKINDNLNIEVEEIKSKEIKQIIPKSLKELRFNKTIYQIK